MAKIQKQLNLTCPACSSAYQLLEIHEQKANHCPANCQTQWEELLNQHYQDCLVLHFAHEEAEKEKLTEQIKQALKGGQD